MAGIVWCLCRLKVLCYGSIRRSEGYALNALTKGDFGNGYLQITPHHTSTTGARLPVGWRCNDGAMALNGRQAHCLSVLGVTYQSASPSGRADARPAQQSCLIPGGVKQACRTISSGALPKYPLLFLPEQAPRLRL